jgi:hypothetical protein
MIQNGAIKFLVACVLTKGVLKNNNMIINMLFLTYLLYLLSSAGSPMNILWKDGVH